MKIYLAFSLDRKRTEVAVNSVARSVPVAVLSYVGCEPALSLPPPFRFFFVFLTLHVVQSPPSSS